jgi:hypothetical protein
MNLTDRDFYARVNEAIKARAEDLTEKDLYALARGVLTAYRTTLGKSEINRLRDKIPIVVKDILNSRQSESDLVPMTIAAG